MLELYSDLIDTSEPQPDQETTQTNPRSDQKEGYTTQKTTQTALGTTQTEPDTTQTTTQTNQDPTQSGFDTTNTSISQSLTIQEQIMNELRKNPNLSRKELAKLITSVTEDGIKYHLKKLQDKGLLRRIGANFGGHREILKSD